MIYLKDLFLLSAKNYIFAVFAHTTKTFWMSIFKICKNLGERKKNFDYLFMLLGFPDAQTVKNMPTVQETGV